MINANSIRIDLKNFQKLSVYYFRKKNVYLIMRELYLRVTPIGNVPSCSNSFHGVTRFLRNVDSHVYTPYDFQFVECDFEIFLYLRMIAGGRNTKHPLVYD